MLIYLVKIIDRVVPNTFNGTSFNFKSEYQINIPPVHSRPVTGKHWNVNASGDAAWDLVLVCGCGRRCRRSCRIGVGAPCIQNRESGEFIAQGSVSWRDVSRVSSSGSATCRKVVEAGHKVGEWALQEVRRPRSGKKLGPEYVLVVLLC